MSSAVFVGFMLPKKTNRERIAEAKARRRTFMENGAARIIQLFWRAVLMEREWHWWRMRMIAKVQVRTGGREQVCGVVLDIRAVLTCVFFVKGCRATLESGACGRADAI